MTFLRELSFLCEELRLDNASRQKVKRHELSHIGVTNQSVNMSEKKRTLLIHK